MEIVIILYQLNFNRITMATSAAELFKREDTVVHHDKASGLYFGLQEINESSQKVWLEYLVEQIDYIDNEMLFAFPSLKEHSEAIKRKITVIRSCNDPLCKLKTIVFSNDSKSVRWVAFASKKDPYKITSIKGEESPVEMQVGVVSAEWSKVQVHMGISRNVFMLAPNAKRKLTPKLSCVLHGFAAKVLKRDFVVTSPMKKMEEILKAKLPEGSWEVNIKPEDSFRYLYFPEGLELVLSLGKRKVLELKGKEQLRLYDWFFTHTPGKNWFVIDAKELATKAPEFVTDDNYPPL